LFSNDSEVKFLEFIYSFFYHGDTDYMETHGDIFSL